MRVPVEPSTIGMESAKQPNVQTAPFSRIQQVVGRQTKQRIEQATVVKEK
nr:hypothetical protein pPsy0479a_00109 [Pseudomonas syringae]